MNVNNFTKKSFFSHFFTKNNIQEIDYYKPIINNFMPFEKIIKGIYIHGTTGCGKTMLMDMFYDNLNYKNKIRYHFNEFMLNIHKLNFENRSRLDPLFETCCKLSKDNHIIFLDEFQVADVGDAVIIPRIFNYFWKHGGVLVTTTNREPDDLYKNGIQRETFFPFIHNLKEYCFIYE